MGRAKEKSNIIYPSNEKEKNPSIACLLGIILVGAGNIYIGQKRKGLIMLVLFFTLIILMKTDIGKNIGAFIVVFQILAIIFELISIIDSYNLALKLRSGKSIKKDEWFIKF